MSHVMGSRNDQTTIYFDGEGRTEVVCGCFSGTVEKFVSAVNKTHGESSAHARAYLKWVNRVKQYIEGGKA